MAQTLHYGWAYIGDHLGKAVIQVVDTVDPAISDDETKGIIRFCRWINLASMEEYVCLDPTAGSAVWKGTTSGGGGGGAVSSVFGRTGAVVAQAGDYDVSEVTDAVDTADARLSDARTPTGPAGGGLSGTYPNPTVPTLVGDSGSGGVAGIVPAPAAGDAAAHKFLHASGAWQTLSSGIEFWSPDAAPVSPSAFDDEFNGPTLDAKWGEWDVPNYVTYAVDTNRKMLMASGLGNGTDRHTGIYQAVPVSGEYAIYARVSIISPSVDGAGLGLFLSQDIVTNPSTAAFRTLLMFCNAGPTYGVDSGQYASYNGARSDGGSLVSYVSSYLRFRVIGTTYWGDCSTDGVQWYTVRTGTLPSSVTHMGIMYNSTNTSIALYGVVGFFRVFEGSGTSALDGTYIGRSLSALPG